MNSAALHLGKLLAYAGITLIVIGVLLMLSSKFSFLGLGHLPGDIAYKGKNISFYFPLVTCIVLSAVLTLILWLLSVLTRR